MTVSELLAKGRDILKNAAVDNYINESRWILEDVFNCSREFLIFQADVEADAEKESEFLHKVIERASGMPVQYIIGAWDFYGESFNVGKGVLIPRPETEILVDFALDYLRGKKKPVIFDLCAGSGCIGISLAHYIKDANVTLVDISEGAINVINENINQMIDCLKDNFTINGSIVESSAIYAAQAKLLAVRDNINSELLEYMENYL
jgi:release factor glutamine methyltransferase